MKRLLHTLLFVFLLLSAAPTAASGNDWYARARKGLFVHLAYSQQGETTMSDGTKALSLDDLTQHFDVDAWLQSVQQLKPEYVVITAWHQGMHMLCPSQAMDRYTSGHTSRRDLLGQMIRGLHKAGIRSILYIHFSDGNELSPAEQTATGWNDPSDGYHAWNRFLYEVTAELGQKYGKLIDGYWLDMTFEKKFQDRVDKPYLHQALLSGNKGRVLIGNTNKYADEPTKFGAGLYDFCSREVNTKDLTDFPCYSQQTAITYMSLEWLANKPNPTILDPDDMLAYTLLTLSCSTEGGICWNLPPYFGTGSMYAPNVLAAYQRIYGLLARLDLRSLRPSTTHATQPGQTLANTQYALMSDKVGRHQYLFTFRHTVTLPAMKITRLTDLDGHPVPFNVNPDGTVTIPPQPQRVNVYKLKAK